MKHISQQLIKAFNRDQEMRGKYDETGIWDSNIDTMNTKLLKEILSQL